MTLTPHAHETPLFGIDHDPTIELSADLPQALGEFVELLEQKQVRPQSESSSYAFEKDEIFYKYPRVVREYLALTHGGIESVEAVSRTHARRMSPMSSPK